MEHGLYILAGAGTGDFVWIGPYVPQQFTCTGWGEASYLLYKDINRDVQFRQAP